MIVRIRRHNYVAAALGALFEPGDGDTRALARLIARARAQGGRSRRWLRWWPRRPLDSQHDGSTDAQRLAEWLNEPLALMPPDRPARTAWQCIVFADPDDRPLTDRQ